jgi:hypothetical protein
MLTMSRVKKLACAIISTVLMVFALVYVHGTKFITEFLFVALIAAGALAIVAAIIASAVFLARRRIILRAASDIGDILKRNPKNIARVFAIAVVALTGLFWFAITLPDPKFNSVKLDNVLVLAFATAIASICVSKHLRTSEKSNEDFKTELAPWFLYPSMWFLFSLFAILSTVSPK